MFAPAPPPPVVAPLGGASYWCADGRRIIADYRPRDLLIRIEHSAPLVLTQTAPNVWRSDAYAGGPLIVQRTGDRIALVSPGWPDTRCKP